MKHQTTTENRTDGDQVQKLTITQGERTPPGTALRNAVNNHAQVKNHNLDSTQQPHHIGGKQK